MILINDYMIIIYYNGVGFSHVLCSNIFGWWSPMINFVGWNHQVGDWLVWFVWLLSLQRHSIFLESFGAILGIGQNPFYHICSGMNIQLYQSVIFMWQLQVANFCHIKMHQKTQRNRDSNRKKMGCASIFYGCSSDFHGVSRDFSHGLLHWRQAALDHSVVPLTKVPGVLIDTLQ